MTPSKSSLRKQREWELWEAYRAAQRLEQSLEMAGLDKRPVKRIREECAALLIDLGQPMPDFS